MKIYGMFGVEPEIQAYAMARYSRSALSMSESINELTAEQAENFLNTFYFEYGHRSIADMAHLALALEDISILAAMRVVDEQLWDGQERSTRYQVFKSGSYVVPSDIQAHQDIHKKFVQACDSLFENYETITNGLVEILSEHYKRPDGLSNGAYRRSLRARAFDISRGLLPVATKTSVGQVVSARVLENQITRLLSDDIEEVRAIGNEMREACTRPASNPMSDELVSLFTQENLTVLPLEVQESAAKLLQRVVSANLSPTLVKYAEKRSYPKDMLRKFEKITNDLMEGQESYQSKSVEYARDETPEEEIISTLLYRTDAGGHSYAQIQDVVATIPKDEMGRLLALAWEDRGSHDEIPRELHSGYQVKFDLLMDIGAYRDLHRHRRCTQIAQGLTTKHGYIGAETTFLQGLEDDALVRKARQQGLLDLYESALGDAGSFVDSISSLVPHSASYALPLGYRTRALFKMDAAEAAYIIELRTKEGGHFSYRNIAWEMLNELKEKMPTFSQNIRATDPNIPVDIFQR
ncbi:FAD-dependent thymidylate synthase [Dehalococcoidia bacterium]|nr:FAD-dependent thymidylate synthase [Dehalococcoidia bacterium]